MATTFNYNASFSGRAVFSTDEMEGAREALNKLLEAREAGEKMEDFYEYLSRSEDLETFIKRCVVRAVQGIIVQEFDDNIFRNVGDIRVTING